MVITGITADSITYMDPGAGPDKQNQVETISKNEFLKAWSATNPADPSSGGQGNVTMESSVLGALHEAPLHILSTDELKSIRGAFFFFFIPMIIGAIASIGSAVGAILTTVGSMIAGIGSFIAVTVANISMQIGAILQGIGTAIYQGIQYAGATFGKFFSGNLFSSNLLQNGFGNFSLNNFGSKIVDQAVAIGLNFATQRGLEAIGVDPTVTRLAGAFVSGGVVGNLGPAFNATSFITGGIQSMAFQATRTVFESAGINPTFSNFFALSSQNFLEGAINGTLNGAIVQIAKDLEVSLLKYGVESLGDAIGLPQELSQAMGGPMAGLIYSRLPSLSFIPQVTLSDTTGQAAIDNDYYFDVERGQNIPIPGPDSPARSWWDNAYVFFRDNLPEIIGVGISAYYLTHPGSNLNNNSQNSVQVDAPAPSGSEVLTYEDLEGNAKEGYKVQTGSNSYEIYDKKTGLLVERSSGGITERGRFSYKITRNSDGSMSLDLRNPEYVYEGDIKYVSPDGGELRFKVLEKNINEVYLEKPSPDIVLRPDATTDETGKILSGSIDFVNIYLVLVVSDGKVTDGDDGDSVSSGKLMAHFSTSFIFGNGFENEVRLENTPDPLMEAYVYDLEYEQPTVINSAKKLVVYLYEMTKLLGNSLDWIRDFKPGFLIGLLGALGLTDIAADRIIQAVANSEPLDPTASDGEKTFFQVIQDKFRSFSESTGLGNNLVSEVINELEELQSQKGKIKDAIAFAHSGFTNPILTAIEEKQYDVETVLIYEGPHANYKAQFTNPNLKRIIHVMGSNHRIVNSMAEGDAPVPFLGWAEFTNLANPNFENINIEIKGAFHNDYSYNPGDYADRTFWDENKARRQMINRRTNLFMRDLYQAAYTDQSEPGRLQQFFELQENRGAATKVNGIWKIDPDKLRDIV